MLCSLANGQPRPSCFHSLTNDINHVLFLQTIILYFTHFLSTTRVLAARSSSYRSRLSYYYFKCIITQFLSAFPDVRPFERGRAEIGSEIVHGSVTRLPPMNAFHERNGPVSRNRLRLATSNNGLRKTVCGHDGPGRADTPRRRTSPLDETISTVPRETIDRPAGGNRERCDLRRTSTWRPRVKKNIGINNK